MNLSLKTFRRNIVKYKYFHSLNILGLVLGISSTLFLFAYVLNEFRYDRYHRDGDRVYRLSCSTLIDDKRTEFANLPPAFGPALKERIPEIEHIARLSLPYTLNNGISKIKYNDRQFYQADVYLADSSVFSVLSFEFLAGTAASSLQDPNTIVLTETLAAKLFGTENRQDMIGNSINIDDVEFHVTGIVADVPYHSHLRPQALISWRELGRDDVWHDAQAYTYVKIRQNATEEQLREKLNEFVNENENVREVAETFGARVSLFANPLSDIHLYSHKQFEASTNAEWSYIYIFIVVGILFTLCSGVNYLNLSIAIAQKRNKEVGICKVLGAENSSIRKQFIAEAMILAAIATGLSVLLFYLLIPSFNTLFNYNLSDSIVLHPPFLAACLMVALAIGAIAGIYPSRYMAGLAPLTVLKNKQSTTSASRIPLRKLLIVFQFTVASIMISVILVISTQIDYLLNVDLGFDKSNIMVIKIPDVANRQNGTQNLKKELQALTAVANVSISDYLPGTSDRIDEHMIERKDGEMKSSTISRILADENFLDLLSIRITEGQNFDKQNPSAQSGAFLVNQAAVHQFEWNFSSDGAIGKKIDGINYNTTGNVIGVFEDVKLFSLKQKVRPLVISHNPSGSFLYVKIKDLHGTTFDAIKKMYDGKFGDYPFEYVLLDESYQRLYSQDRQLRSTIGLGTFILIVISCLGLLGLATFMMSEHTKQIGIRKILGASVTEIITYYGRSFITLITIGNLIAFPISFLYIRNFLESYPYHTALSAWFFIMPLLITLVLCVLTIGGTVIRASRVNPVVTLRYE